METPEEFHRLELKKIGYRDEPTEKIIKLYASNHTYTFAEKYHQEQLRICAVSQRSELLAFLKEVSESTTIYSNTRHKLIAKELLKANCG